MRPEPPAGFEAVAEWPGWYLRIGGDAQNDADWYQAVPEGWVQWDQDPAYWYNLLGDASKEECWWFGGRIQQPKPVYERPWYLPAFEAWEEMIRGRSPYDFGGDRTQGYFPRPAPPAKGWDCVGAVMNALDACDPPLGDFLSGQNQGYINAEKARQLCQKIDASEVQPGDMVFFKNTYPTPGASHIGMVLDSARSLMYDDNGSRPNGVGPGINDYSTPYWRQHFLSFGRVLQ